jgi:ferric-dicitrate binding protein FerR (iron transport regulator)
MDKLSSQEEAAALLIKYRAGLCTPEEEERVKRWYDSFDTENPGKIKKRQANDAAKAALQQLFSNQPKIRLLIPLVVRIAACLLLALSACWVFFNQHTDSGLTYTKYTTNKGERKTLTLSDGSEISLNAASSLQVPSDFGEKQRNVILSGEAFFKISKDKVHPFIIRTGKLFTRVVGTSFNIQAYPEDALIKVAVATGKVQVEKETTQGRILIGRDLTHNHLLTYNVSQDVYKNTFADVQLAKAWQNDTLVFNQASLSEIAHVIERRYNVRVALKGTPQLPCRYTVTFGKYPLDRLLPLLSDLTGVTYLSNNHQLILNIKNCK